MDEDWYKRGEALRRAMPLSRMLDYGLDESLAQTTHDHVVAGMRWEDVLTGVADVARREGKLFTAAVAMNFAQMASNFDTPERIALFRLSTQDFIAWAAESGGQLTRYRLDHKGGQLFGWDFPTTIPTAPTVIVVGGMSGWASSFVSMARALNARGLRCLLLDGPGQGETRINGRIYLQHGYPGAISAVVDDLMSAGCLSVGIWGNSMGGLFAAVSTRDDERIGACCINGAPTSLIFPEFRTAREQIAAMFGVLSVEAAEDLPEVAKTLQILAFEGGHHPLHCPTLICEGGADPLVPLDSQRAFLIGNTNSRSSVLSWADGEHTIYNHTAERNASVSNWFRSVL
ncbi:MAG: alpha/beta hydrolase [Burkholderiaceae bacterium]|nr:alpha/beta hydrolase [Burkholderiaceae bacterium]